ncbi:hypothetical protein EOM60_05590 [Candidatus Saccharibacteria bacterium]|nr:hypothetical protein [Candidatus Saccharibacteria bacterium]
MDNDAIVTKQFSVRRFEELLIYFVLGTIAGRYIEIIWQYFRYHITDPLYSAQQLLAPPLAEPYGLGVIAVILLVEPIIRKYKLNVGKSYILSVVVTCLVEYISAIALVLVFGQNDFWDYSDQPFNIQGHVSLETSLLFGLLAMLFLKFVYPNTARKFDKMTNRQVKILALVLTILYSVLFLLSKRG